MNGIHIVFDAANARFEGSLDPNIKDHLRELMSWEDKSASYLKQKGFSYIDTKRCCFNDANNQFPTGLLPRVIDRLKQFGVAITYECRYQSFLPTPAPLPEWAYEHQKLIVQDAIANQRALVQSPTGSGKSYAAALYAQWFPDRRILIVVPSVNLLHNIKKPMEQLLEEKVGMIGDGKTDWKRVTIGIINSLSKHATGKFKAQLAAQEVLITDEAHGGASSSHHKLSDACPNTAYRLGLSATAYRSDGADILLEGVIGPKTLVIPADTMVELGVIHAPQAFFIRNEMPELTYQGAQVSLEGKITYCSLPNSKPDLEEVYIKQIVKNDERNRKGIMVARQFLNYAERGGNCLMMVHLLEHGRRLQQLAAELGLEVDFIDGGCKGQKRMQVLDEFRSGERQCLIASSILNEGEDLPSLELLINFAGRANKRITTQRNGRVVRKDSSGKKQQAYIVDFYDSEPYYLNYHSRKRMSIINNAHPKAAQVTDFDYVMCLFKN